MLALISKYRAVVFSAGITLLSSSLKFLSVIEIGGFSPRLIAAIFTVIIGSTATLFSILIIYGELIAAADKKEYLQDLERTFRWPVGTAVFGFIIAILSSTFSLTMEYTPSSAYGFTIDEIMSLIMLFILIYAILAFRESFLFVLKSAIKMESKEDGNDGPQNEMTKQDKTSEREPEPTERTREPIKQR